MKTTRLEAFSDAVLAIIITIMVLGVDIPAERDLHSLVRDTGNGLVTYVLSFIYVGIYWNNHHHMFHLVTRVSGGVLWANLGLLFLLSLLPLTTQWMDESELAHTPVVVYGANLFLAAAAYSVLQAIVMRQEGPDSLLRRAVGSDVKGKVSLVVYLIGMASAAFIDHGRIGVWLALASYAVVAVAWIVPDRRIALAVRDGVAN